MKFVRLFMFAFCFFALRASRENAAQMSANESGMTLNEIAQMNGIGATGITGATGETGGGGELCRPQCNDVSPI